MTVIETPDDEAIFHGSDWPHVEDLIRIADALVTDYSSVAFDFTVTGKPVIQYLSDQDEYEEERGLYSPETVPGSKVARTCEELVQEIGSTCYETVSSAPIPDITGIVERITALLVMTNQGPGNYEEAT